LNWFFNDPQSMATLGMARGIPPTEKGQQLLVAKNIMDKNLLNAVKLGAKNAGLPENALTTNNEMINISREVLQKMGFNKLTPDQAADELINGLQAKLVELKAHRK